MREGRQTRSTLVRESVPVFLLTSISKAPVRPHEVVVGLAEAVAGAADAGGTRLLAGVEDIGRLADGEGDELEAGVGITGIGVSDDRCQSRCSIDRQEN